jgi:uncharacterized repeat protein (TIGR03847 family)
MSASFEIDPVDRITAGAVGEPGQRTFYLQAQGAGSHVTLLAEKDQVRVLAQALNQLLAQIPDGEEGAEPDEPALALSEPLLPEFRIGEMSLEFDEPANKIVITLNEISARAAADEDDDEEPEDAPELEPELEPEDLSRARFVATRAQARAMAEHALEVVAAGRPRCQFCGYPMNPGEDHVCPAMNGHGRPRD